MNEVDRNQEEADSPVRVRTDAASLTRRELLAGTGRLALMASLPIGCVPLANKPWADGTFWDDGKGWTA